MIYYLKCSGKSHVTGRLIATAISQLQGRKCVYSNKDELRSPSRRHVRWGSRARTSANGINSLAGVRLASNKLLAIVQLNRQGVLTPRLFSAESFFETTNVRRIFRQSSRQNANDRPYFVEIDKYPDPVRAAVFDYALEHIPSDHEYRVYMFGGESIMIEEKVPAAGYDPSPDVRSYSHGWTAEGLNVEPCHGLIETAARAVTALGLHFGAVDILHGRDGRLFVLEVNTAPALEPREAMLFAKAFVKWDESLPENS